MPIRALPAVLFVLLFFSACTTEIGDAPVRPVEPPMMQATPAVAVVTLVPKAAGPSPAPTANADLPGPTPAPTPTAGAAAWGPVEGNDSGGAVDLSAYALDAEVVYSADGAWEVEALRGEIRSGDPQPPPYSYLRLTAENRSAGLRWVAEELLPAGGPETGAPAGFTFTVDGEHLYFYNHTQISGSCSVEFNHSLRRWNLRTGELEATPGIDAVTHFTLSPDAAWMASLSGADLLLRHLATGAEKIIPLTPPQGENPGISSMAWSPDGRKIALNFSTNTASCEMRHFFLGTHIVDVEAGTARRFESPENVVGVMYWSDVDTVVVQTGRDTPAAVNIATLQSEPFQIAPETIAARVAQSGLRSYLRSIYLSAFDPEEFGLVHAQQAAEKFSGDWGPLSERYPTMRFASPGAMLRYACKQGDLKCGAVRQIQLAEIFGEDRFVFEVQFVDQSGNVVTAGGQDRFRFVVESRFPEVFRVENLPPLTE